MEDIMEAAIQGLRESVRRWDMGEFPTVMPGTREWRLLESTRKLIQLWDAEAPK